MNGLVGSTHLARLILRRDRIRISVWVVAITIAVYAQAVSVKGLYPTRADLVSAAKLIHGNAAFIAMGGPAYAVDTLGGRVTFEISAFAMVIAALMNLFLVTRHIRGDEEAGRTELLRSTIVGRSAPMAAALAVAGACDLILFGTILGALSMVGLPFAGSAALAAGIASVGFVFAAVGAFSSQLTLGTRAASGIAGTVLAVTYVLRAVGDVRGGILSWFSTIGWGQAMKPFAGEQWWVLAAFAFAAVCLVGVAHWIGGLRDVGSGVFPPRPGPQRAPTRLLSPVGLAIRLHRGSVIGWCVALFLGGVAYGSIGGDVDDFVKDNKLLADFMAQTGGNVVDSFLATTTMVLALIGTGFALQALLRLNSEEAAGRAEPILATALSRLGWVGSHLVVVVAGTLAVLVVAGLGTGVMFGALVGHPSDVPRLIAASLAYTPAVLIVVSVGVALYGLRAGASVAVWPLLGFLFMVDFFGEALSLPDWLRNLSPYHHVPMMPAVGFDPVPLVVMLVIAAVFSGLGLAAIRSRDIGTA